jgi:hypothetical protein
MVKDRMVRLKEEDEGLGDLTTTRNGDAKPFTILLKEGKEERENFENFAPRKGAIAPS